MTMMMKPAAEIERDRYGRPLVVPPGGGKPTAYSRCTTFVGVLEDMFNLQQWEKRMVALGLNLRPDLRLAVSAHSDDKRQLNKICDAAKEAALASAAATTGTALHALTERMDRGEDVGQVPSEYLADLAAYQEKTQPLTAVHIEQFCVLDTYKIGGTPDRVVEYNGKRYIADVKTGSIEFGTLKIAMQLAVYTRSKTYDIATHERGDHGAEFDKAIIIHLPAGEGRCTLHWVDTLAGWEAVKIARAVRDWRTRKFTDLTEPFEAPRLDPFPDPPTDSPTPIDQAIAECLTVRALLELWETRWQEFTDEHKNLAAKKKAALQDSNPAA